MPIERLVGAVCEADLKRMADRRGRISRRGALHAGEEVDVLGRRQGGIERHLLGPEPEHAAAASAGRLCRLIDTVPASKRSRMPSVVDLPPPFGPSSPTISLVRR
jgi:hypothetical protein